MRVIKSNAWLPKVEMEEIKRNIEVDNNINIDIDQAVRDRGGDRVIQMDVIADRRVKQDDLDENKKRYLII